MMNDLKKKIMPKKTSAPEKTPVPVGATEESLMLRRELAGLIKLIRVVASRNIDAEIQSAELALGKTPEEFMFEFRNIIKGAVAQ